MPRTRRNARHSSGADLAALEALEHRDELVDVRLARANDRRARPNVSRSCMVAITVLRRQLRAGHVGRRRERRTCRTQPDDTSPTTIVAGASPTTPSSASPGQLACRSPQRHRPHRRRRRRRSRYERRRRHRVPAAREEQLGDVLDPPSPIITTIVALCGARLRGPADTRPRRDRTRPRTRTRRRGA